MRLLLMRHATTALAKDGNDLERLLTGIGQAEAIQAGKFLAQYRIDKKIVSYAKRTLQTHSITQEQMRESKLQVVEELYNGDISEALDLIHSQEDHYKNILVIGHNPLIYDLALILAKRNSPQYDDLSSSLMPPGRIVIIDFPNLNNWHDLQNSSGEIVDIFTPSISK
ncbi:MAG: histidine phosphatase family protein [Rickettsiaceae bacterium]|nr:histidine phosphatase family protein [Rickettsiaceae bacterium]